MRVKDVLEMVAAGGSRPQGLADYPNLEDALSIASRKRAAVSRPPTSDLREMGELLVKVSVSSRR